jgi:hypothetical protein
VASLDVLGGPGSEGEAAVTWTLHEGDCRDVLPTLPDASVDAAVTDPPYAEIDRDYGRLTEPQWHELMEFVVGQVQRILKPSGSAVYIIQPNFERLGRMRPWAFEFMAKAARDWGMVQDVYWWNVAAMPTAACQRAVGLSRPSCKPCVWVGPADCYRAQAEILISPSEATRSETRADSALLTQPSGHHIRRARMLALDRGGSTPFNVIALANTDSTGSAGASGHGAGTPAALCSWWVRYICPPGGVVLDPFAGTSTVGAEALKSGRSFIGIEKMPAHCESSRRRLRAASAQPSLFSIPVADPLPVPAARRRR